jgi:hypothetical protein
VSPAGLVAVNAGAGVILAARGHPFGSAAIIALGAEAIGVLLGRMYPEKLPLLAGETATEYATNVGVVIASWWVSRQLIAPYQLPRGAR